MGEKRVRRGRYRSEEKSRGSERESEDMEKEPWYTRVEGPFPEWQGPVGVKEDGGGSTYAQGKVGGMVIHRAVNNQDAQAIKEAVEGGVNVNEVEAAGNTPLHNCAYTGWLEGAELLLSLGAKINASNNAGDTPWHWARNMRQDEMMVFLEKSGASKEKGHVLVPDHVPKVKDFFEKECWAHHPKPHESYIEAAKKRDEAYEKEANKLIPGM